MVALKMIRAGRFAEPDDVRRFLLEAEALAGLEHPNIVPIYEFGEHDGRHYFAMKFIAGGSLAQRVTRSSRGHEAQTPSRITDHALRESEPRDLGCYEAKEVATLLAKVSRAVHYAHQRGVLHRDLKPANILLDADGEPLVSDFGLAKRTGAGGDFSLSGTMVGSPSYMAPEQAAGDTKHLTTAADTWSLGAILYHLLTGCPPFRADTPLATMKLVMEKEPIPPRLVVRSSRRKEAQTSATETLPPKESQSLLTSAATCIDRDLETICLKCLRKDPAQRYSTAEALAEDLERWLRGEPILARPSTFRERVVKWTRRRPALAGLLALALFAPAVIIALLLVDEARLRRERRHTDEQRDNALRHEQKANTAAVRAEAGELAARERAYAADIYAAFQALSVDDLARARRLLNEHRPPLVVPALAGSATHTVQSRLATEAGTTNPDRLKAGLQTDLRGFEWRVLWERTRGQEAFAFTNLARPAECLVFAPDGRTLVSGGGDGIHLWDIVERRSLGLFPGPDPGPPPRDIAPTIADLQILLDASPAVVEHIKAQPEIVDYLDALGHTNRTREVTCLAFTPDGNHLVVGSRDLVRSWNFATRAFEFAVPESYATVAMPALGDIFAVGNHQESGVHDERRSAHPQSALVYSFIQRRLVAELPGYGWRVAVSPDGQHVAAASRTNGAVLWHASSGAVVSISRDPEFHGLPAFSPDGRTLLVGSDSHRPTMLWDVASKRIKAYLRGERLHVSTVAWLSDGRYLAGGGANQTIHVWTVPPAGVDAPLEEGTPFISSKIVLHGHEAKVTALAFSPDGRWLISAANDHSIRVWAIADALAAVAPAASGPYPSMHEFAMDSVTGCILGRAGRELTLWRPQSGYAAHSLPRTENQFPAGFLADGAGFVTVEMTTNGLPTHLEIRGLPDGVVQTRREIVPVPKELQSEGADEHRRLAVSPDGQWLAVEQRFDRRSYVYVYTVATGRFVARLRTPLDGLLYCLRASPDSRWLILTAHSSDKNSITVFDTRDWQLVREIRFRSTGEHVAAASVDPTSRFIATGGSGESSIRIWDLHTGQLMGQCSGG